ncbi:hypothetical protein, partial [Natrialba sp. PRR66]|uniref:hypothetical protein n=1 Tax=Natrialba sp. PRR66 TaxID=3098146 RepID=UPI002B1D247B
MMEGLHEELRFSGHGDIKITTIYPFMVDTGLCKNPRIKFDTMMKILKPDQVAKKIMTAQRMGVKEISLPGYLL